jgi:diguanylate cyclase
VNGRLHTPEGIELARTALGLMAEHGVAPTPQNYAVWVSYASDSIPELCEALQERIARGGPIEDDFCEDLYERHFTFKRIQDAVLETGGAMSRELGVVVRTLEDAERDTAAYGEALAGVGGALETSTDESSLRRMVEGLVSATARMQRRSRELERRMQETSSEVDQLKRSAKRR